MTKIKDFFKRIRLGTIVSALLTIALGVVVIIYPDQVPIYAAKVVGGFLMIMGGVGLIANIISEDHGRWFLFGNLIILLLGVWIFFMPKTVLSLIPMFLGVLLIIDAINDFKIGADARRYEYPGWIWHILFGVICAVLGMICICSSFGVIEFGMILIGISLIFDGITDFFIVFQANRAQKAYTNAVKTAEAIDVEYTETPIEDQSGDEDSSE